jgi:hypothetical protein
MFQEERLTPIAQLSIHRNRLAYQVWLYCFAPYGRHGALAEIS